MSVQVADDVATLFDGEINVNEPIDWAFLGADFQASDAPPWSPWSAYQAGDCARIPNEGVWCARRSVRAGEVGPGERGWEHVWERKSTLLGHDPAAYSAASQRFSGRGGRPVLGALVADFHVVKQAYRDAVDKGEHVGDDLVSQAAATTKKIIRRARDEATPASAPAMVTHYDATDEVSIDPVQLEILGEDGIDERNFPITSGLYRRFRASAEPTFVRLDTEESYPDYRGADLHRKVAALDALLHAHLADGHGGQDIVVGLASDISALQDETAARRVPLKMPPWADGTWDCWREPGPEGGLVCCSMALPGHDGTIRICTNAAPVKRRVEDVARYAREEGGDVVTLLGVLPTIACMLTGRDLMTGMAAAAPKILAHPAARSNTPFVGRIVPANQPTMAAIIALLQTAQSGNAQAAREWGMLAEAAGKHPELTQSMIEARRRLLAAQANIYGWDPGWSPR